MVGLHRAFPRSLAEAPIRRVRCGFHLSGETALGKSLRAEFGSADRLPTFGLINCLFAQRTGAAVQTGIFQGCKTLKWELEVIPLFSKYVLSPAGRQVPRRGCRGEERGSPCPHMSCCLGEEMDRRANVWGVTGVRVLQVPPVVLTHERPTVHGGGGGIGDVCCCDS